MKIPSKLNENTIKAELGRALAVVKVTLQVNGYSQYLGVCPPKNYGGDKDNTWHK